MKRVWLSWLLAAAGIFRATAASAQDMPVEAPAAAVTAEAPAPTATELPGPKTEPSPALTRAELQSLGLDADESGLDTSFHFSGFSDFTAYFPIDSQGVAALGTARYQSFYIGNLNLYVSKNLSDAFRTMAEVRFTYLPNGALVTSGSSLSYTSTQVLDYADTNHAKTWGGIIIERAYLEWTLHQLAVLRFGQFLTPYGIWNVDHGSPAYLPIQRPYAIDNNWFPERQTGIELFGSWDSSNRSTFTYHLTISNGDGPISEYRDLDTNKAIGARLYWEHHGDGFLHLGASGYYGRDTKASPTATLVRGEIDVGADIYSQFDALALAADVQFKLHGWLLQGEWVGEHRSYTRAGRVAQDIILGPVPKAFPVDAFSWGAYALVGYQLPWLALTPYVMTQLDHEVMTAPLVVGNHLFLVLVHGGLNLHPTEAVTFKLEFAHGEFISGGPLFQHAINTAQVQAAWAF